MKRPTDTEEALSQDISQAVSAFYERFPYPAVSTIEEPLPKGFATRALSHRLARPRDAALPERPDIWVAGCGTRQAAQVALQHRGARIYATDISRTSLDRTQTLLDALGLDDVELAHVDLLESTFESRFDLVYCTGVLHHTADPQEGARRLRRALRPGGAALLMVYNEIHRRPFVIFQRCIELLAQRRDDPEERLALARQLLSDILARDVCIPLRNDLAGYDRLAERDFENFVDALIHPREVSYDIDSLHGLIEGAGLRFVDWLYPPFWDPNVFFGDEALRARAAELPQRERDKLLFFTGGYSCPYFDVIVERDDAPARVAFDDAALLAMRPLLSAGKNVYRVEGERVHKPRRQRPFTVDGKRIVVELAREGYIHPKRWALPREVVPLLEACDGATPIGDIVRRFDDTFEREEMLSVLHELLPGRMNLLAPM